MVFRSLHIRRALGLAALAGTVLVLPALRPSPVLAHWGVCNNDPKVWLANGTQVDLHSSVQADPTMVSQITFTLHVPFGIAAAHIVYTGGADVPPETVNVVSDSLSGYTVTFTATTVDEAADPTTLVAHTVDQSSAWATASGVSNQAMSLSIGNG